VLRGQKWLINNQITEFILKTCIITIVGQTEELTQQLRYPLNYKYRKTRVCYKKWQEWPERWKE
jgi:hypothetical protein